MPEDSEFITKLIGFGLSEKEARLYLHLLKYGPKPPSLLAKSLKTYREDIYRTLQGLIDKGVVNPSLETPTVYAAVELDIALESAFKKHETELREMKRRKQELQELSKQLQFRHSDEFTQLRMWKSVKEAVAGMLSTLSASAIEKEFVFVIPGIWAAISSRFGAIELVKKLIESGIDGRGICEVTYPIIEPVQELLDIGMDVRHYDQYRGIYFLVVDRKSCVSAINTDIKRVSLDESFSAFSTQDATYINNLISTFELLWEQAVPAARRIEELLKAGPPQV